MIRLGIYGYECTKEAVFDTHKIIPLYADHLTVQRLASDRQYYHLTGFLEIINESLVDLRQLTYDLEGILSFIDHRDVVIANPLHDSEKYDDLKESYPTFIRGHVRHDGGGKVVMSDAFSPSSRREFIALATAKLNDSADPNNATFRNAFYKTIEVFRATEPFIDVSYCLLFSSLESLSRAVTGDERSKAATTIVKLLNEYGFDVRKDDMIDSRRAIATYVHLRNALFHQGKYEKIVNVNRDMVTLSLSTFLSPFERLLPLVMMKYIGFDDGFINWNGWLDRMMFKAQAT